MGNYKGTSGEDDIASITEPTIAGARDAFRQKNIYDMAGNVWEWTMELYSSNYINRGGSYGASGLDYVVSCRNNSAINIANSYLGFRVALYIK